MRKARELPPEGRRNPPGLQGNPLFEGLDDARFLQALAVMDAERVRYEKGETFHAAGTPVRRFGIVLTGAVQVCVDDIEGNRMIMAEVTPGMTFGESLCFLKIPDSPVYFFAAEELLKSRGFDRSTRDLFLKATRFVSTREELSCFLTEDMHPRARAAIERLMDLCSVMEAYGFSRYISYDLSLLSKYRYYTGIVFKGYTYGAGDAIASGGRYDLLLSHYGKNAAAIGVMIQLDLLMEALRRQNIGIETEQKAQEIRLDSDNAADKIRRASQLRNEGTAVILQG